MSDAFANAWRLLKQIRLSPEERGYVNIANPKQGEDGLGARKTLMQSNLGLFDPGFELTTLNTDFKKVPVRVGRGKRKEETPVFERQYVKLTRDTEDPRGRYAYRLMGVPANGGPHVEMSYLAGYPYDTANSHLSGLAPHHTVPRYLTSISGETPKEFRRKRNYEKLMQAILASGMGIVSDNRNRVYSNPFHRKFSTKHKDLYQPKREYEDGGGIDTDERILYNRPEIRRNGETVIEQTPREGVNPKGGFGSLARFDLNTLPIVEHKRQHFKTRNPDAKNTEQTLFAEGYLANANRGKLYPQNIHEFMVKPNDLTDNKRANEEMIDQVPYYNRDYYRYKPRQLAIGQSAAFANHPTLSDLTTGEPVLIAQPGGKIEQGTEYYEIQQRKIQREMKEREKAERLQAMMMEMSQLIPNPQESLTHPDNSAFMQAYQTLQNNAQPQQYQNMLGDDDDFDGLGSILG